MPVPDQVGAALQALGWAGPPGAVGCRRIGEGAWHDAYLVERPGGPPLVVRIRKAVIYGQAEAFDEQGLRSDYEPVACYYRQANGVRPGVCPALFVYRLSPALTFTAESYMGLVIPWRAWDRGAAARYGAACGEFFAAMDRAAPGLAGFGPLRWNGGAVAGEDRRPLPEIRQTEAESHLDRLERLAAAAVPFDRAVVRSKLRAVLDGRRFEREPVALINRDVTPENLMLQPSGAVGLIDPYPALGNGIRSAAWFVFCYRFLFPALDQAPRYRRHQFGRHAPILGAMADGFAAGYAGGQAVRQARQMEYWLHMLREAWDCWASLGRELSQKEHRQGGGPELRARRLRLALAELERLPVG